MNAAPSHPIPFVPGGHSLPLLLLLLVGGFSCAPASVLEVEVGPAYPVDSSGLGVNGNLAAFDRPWDDPRLLAAYGELGARHLRYPAGMLANYWDWDTGWIDAAVPDSLMIGWVVSQGLPTAPRRYPLENLAKLTAATGSVPILVLNMLSKDLEHSLRNLRRADSLGIPVQYVELGNEFYFDLPFFTLRYPTPEDYGRTCQRWIQAIKAEFPAARCAVVGNYLDRHPRQIGWTRRVLTHCPAADAVTYHVYTPSGLDGRMVRRDPTPGREGQGNPYTATRGGPRDLRGRQAWERELLRRDPAALANLLTTARAGAAGWRKLDAPAGTDIWATEFNMRDDSSVVLGSWAQVMLLSVYYGEYATSPVSVTTIHNITGALFGTIYTEPGQTGYLLDRPVAVKPYALTAAGLATALFARSSYGAASVRQVHYPEAPLLTDDRGQTVASLRGYWYQGAATNRALVFNYGSEQRTVRLPRALADGQAYTYRAALDRTIMGWADVDHTTTYPSDGTLILPPASVTELVGQP